MFNVASTNARYNNWKTLGGCSPGDYQTYKTMFAGPDPAEPSRVLIRKIVQTSQNKWCFEETTVTPNADGGAPTVHTTLHRLGWFDINEELTEKELVHRLNYRPAPNIIGFSVFSRCWANSTRSSFNLSEATYNKQSTYRWQEWFKDQVDRRNIASYLWWRWTLN